MAKVASSGRHHGGGTMPRKPTAKLDGLPKGHKKVTTRGRGGGRPVKMKQGPTKGWFYGGEKRKHVYGKTSHPVAPAPSTLPWGFVPIANYLENSLSADLQDYYQKLPQNITRPGGQLVEMKITPAWSIDRDIMHGIPGNATPTAPFFFVSDNYTALQIRHEVNQNCLLGAAFDLPIAFNSTGNIRLGNVLQYYRGDSAAVVFQDFDLVKELNSGKNLSFPNSFTARSWKCMNSTIGSSIPLMHGAANPLRFLALLLLLLLLPLIWRSCHKKRDNYHRIDYYRL